MKRLLLSLLLLTSIASAQTLPVDSAATGSPTTPSGWRKTGNNVSDYNLQFQLSGAKFVKLVTSYQFNNFLPAKSANKDSVQKLNDNLFYTPNKATALSNLGGVSTNTFNTTTGASTQDQINSINDILIGEFETLYGDSNWVSTSKYVYPVLANKAYQVLVIGNGINKGSSYTSTILRQNGTSPQVVIDVAGGFTLQAGYEAQAGDRFLVQGSGVYTSSGGGGGGGGVPDTRIITINGVAQTLAADITYTITNIAGSAASLSAPSALPNNTTVTTQAAKDSTTKAANGIYVDRAVAQGLATVVINKTGLVKEVRATNSSDANILLPSTIFIPSDMKSDFYMQNVLQPRRHALTIDGTFQSINNNYAYAPVSSDYLSLDPDYIGTTAQVILKDYQFLDTAWTRSFNVIKAPAKTGTGTLNVLGIGDSVWRTNIIAFLEALATASGRTFNSIGTYGQIGTSSKSEGRSGWLASDFSNFSNTYPYVAPGGEATYLASSDAVKAGFNPLIRASTGGDPSGDVFNSRIVDFADYVTRFGLGTPDIIVFALGTNDLPSTAGTNNYTTSMLSMIRRAKVAFPSVKILITHHGWNLSTAGQDFYNTGGKVLYFYKELIKNFNGKEAQNIYIQPGWAFINPRNYTTAGTSTDSSTRAVKSTSYVDDKHPGTYGQRQFAQSIYWALIGM